VDQDCGNPGAEAAQRRGDGSRSSAIVADALGRRPECSGRYAAQQASLENVRAARSGVLPKLFLSANGGIQHWTPKHHCNPLRSASSRAGPSISPATASASRSLPASRSLCMTEGCAQPCWNRRGQKRRKPASHSLTPGKKPSDRLCVARERLANQLSAYRLPLSTAPAAEHRGFPYGRTARCLTILTDASRGESAPQAKNASTDAYSATLSAAATLALAVGALGRRHNESAREHATPNARPFPGESRSTPAESS